MGIELAEKLDSKNVVSIEEALKAEIYINQALIDLLVEKGILTHDEILEKIKELRVGSITNWNGQYINTYLGDVIRGNRSRILCL